MDPQCRDDFLFTSVHVPILEFENQIYNALHNVGINPFVDNPLTELQGIKTANPPPYPDYADPDMKQYIKDRAHVDVDVINSLAAATPQPSATA
jgi:hypothetical protein